MIKLFILFLLPISLFSSKILSYNIYDRTDRVDIMITFDTPYTGKIKQNITKSMIAIKLEDASIESAKLKQLSSKYIRSLSITPMSQYTKIIASVPEGVILKASKTADAYGLRLRFTTKQSSIKNSSFAKSTTQNKLSNLPTKKENDISQSYYIVIFIMMIGVLTLFIIKKKITPNTIKDQKIKQKKASTSWLFKENKQESTKTKEPLSDNGDVKIRFQKTIDERNSVVMLDFGEQSYLVLMGNSNVLLDKYTDNKPSTQSDFETILQDRHKELDDFLQNKDTRDTVNDIAKKEPLQAYKERAAAILYEN